MDDIYFERLRSRAAEWESLDLFHGGDPALIGWLLSPRPGEAGYLPPVAWVREQRVPTAAGELRMRVYRATSAGGRQRPMLLWCHGGAFFHGDLDMPEADAVAREVCVRADAVVVTVDYRLYFGVRYPEPSDDVMAAFDWAVRTAAVWGADSRLVTLGGAGAGGTLAAGAALRLRDRATTRPASVLLVYPMLHPVLPEPSAELAAKIAGLSPLLRPSADLVRTVIENYLGAPASRAFPYAVPGIESDLRDFPPTLIINCEYDGIRASGEGFARQLRTAGVPVSHYTEEGVAHGYLGRGGGTPFFHAVGHMASWIRGRAGLRCADARIPGHPPCPSRGAGPIRGPTTHPGGPMS